MRRKAFGVQDEQACPHRDVGEPDPATIQTLTSYREVVEVFRSPSMAPFLHDGTEEFRGGTIRQIDGATHRDRRRIMGRLLRRDGDSRFRDEVLLPTIRRNLQRVLADRTGGVPSTDLVLFARAAFFQLAASLIGLDGVTVTEESERLRELADPIQVAMRSWYMGTDRTLVMARGIEARENFRRKYFEPAFQRRRELVASARNSEDEAVLPLDFLTLVAQGLDEGWTTDHELALRETVTDFINAGTFSSSFTLVHAVDECLTWADAHPGEGGRLRDEPFLAQAVVEAIRLHPIVPLFYRTAIEPVTLGSGRTIPAGEHVCLEIGPANRDPEAFGSDADAFVPGRQIPKGIYPYGLSFGSGRHMCFGQPVILGSDGVNGSHVQILKALFAAGVRRVPPQPPQRNDRFGRMDALWDTYPVQFDPTASLSVA